MKRLIIALTTLCLAGGSRWLSAQEYDDVYFTAKDRAKMSYSATVPTQPAALGSPSAILANDPVRSKFANPEYRESSWGSNISILPYFRKDYNQNNTFAGAFRNWNAPVGSFFWGGGWMPMSSAAFWGISPFLTSRWNLGWGWGMPMMTTWNDPWLMNRMMMWDPFWGTPWMSPWGMSPVMTAWNDPWLMNRMMMWDPFWGTPWMSPWGINPLMMRPGIFVVDRGNVQYGSRTDRSSVYTPVRARADEFRSGRTEENTVRSSRYGNFDNSSAGRSAYVTNEYNSGRSSGYAGQSEWAAGRSSNYNMRQAGSHDSFRSSNFGSMSSGRSGFDGRSYGTGGYGSGSIRSVGSRGGRGN